MTKVLLGSDYHLEFFKGRNQYVPKFIGENVLVLAGDIQMGLTEDAWFTDLLEFRDVIYCCGNHEFYHEDLINLQYVYMPIWAARINEYAEKRGFKYKLHALQNQSVEIGNAKFIGATLWTDFNKNDNLIKLMASKGMNDYWMIKYGNRTDLTPNDIYNEHIRSLAYIEEELTKPTGKKIVLVTHHQLSYQAVHEQYRNPRDSDFNYLFYSDLEHILEKCDYALAGHTHNSFDFQVGKCRVVVNPRGYKHQLNLEFKDDLLIDIV